MQKSLLRSLVVCLALLVMRVVPAAASHLIGGEMSYQYLGVNPSNSSLYRYRITALIYINSDCASGANQSNVPDGRSNIFISIYDKLGNRINSGQGSNTYTSVQTSCGVPSSQSESQPAGSFRLQRISNPSITPPQPGGCTLPGGVQPKVRLCRYEAVVDLPISFTGYYAVYTDGTRNADIANLRNPADQNQTMYVEIAPPLLPNSSPTFSDTAVVVVCQGDTSLILNNAVDPDGDRLIYSFSTPYSNFLGSAFTFTPPPTSVNYAIGYSAANPFGTGAGNSASLNASTGLSRYQVAQSGRYVVAVEVKEYRTINGAEVLIGSTRREVQLVARQCPANQGPKLTPPTLSTRSFTIEEGKPLNFNLAASDADGNPITMRVNSVLLDGTGGYNASFAGQPGVVQPGNATGTVNINGTGGNVNGQFVFTPQCGNARLAPYDVVVTATDVTCGAKSVAEVFQITVVKAAGPASINGDNAICDRSVVRTYTAVGSSTSYQWRVYGGTIQGASTSNTVRVLWNNLGIGRVTVRGLSAQGCLSDSTSRTVNIRSDIALAVTPASPIICQGSSTTFTASGGQSYTWTGGGQTYSGATITVSPAQTTTYTVTAIDGTCTAARQVTVTVNPPPTANAGPSVTTCSGVATQLGTAALAGYTYQWSPSTGLSNPTAAQPTLTLANTTGAPQQFTYTVTATSAQGCSATSSVQATINANPTVNAGNDLAICSGVAAQLGSAGLAGYTYQWSPATGLSSSTVAQPTLVLTNNGSAAQQLTYVLTATGPNGCQERDMVVVTLNSEAVAQAGPDRALCSGGTTTLGTAALAGYTYQWSPATNLSSATSAQPVFAATNTSTVDQTLTYTLTATTAQGCTSTSIVRVTVNPAAVANAGPDATLCAQKRVTLGTPAQLGYTYQWSPAVNLSNATTAQPVLTAVNTTASPLTLTYTLTATTAAGCTATGSVRITVNPRPAADSINGTASVCPTVQGVAYTIRNPRSTAY
ncbi:MAG TPA: PKD-like domain-containing protein, partial [Hymenobacter sp.]